MTKRELQVVKKFIISNRTKFDDTLGPVGKETLAAGFYAVGRKIKK